MSMEGNQTVDLRIYDLCRTRLNLAEGEAATLSKELQVLIEEERAILLKHYLEAERADRLDYEAFIEQRIEFLRKDVHNMHSEFSSKLQLSPGSGQYTEMMQWMFTYFAFTMGGVIAVLLLLLKK